MRCLEALGQWDELTEKSTDFMTTDSNNLNQNGMVILTDDKAKTRFREAAKLATMAAWHRENWENFEQNMKHIPTGKFLKFQVPRYRIRFKCNAHANVTQAKFENLIKMNFMVVFSTL